MVVTVHDIQMMLNDLKLSVTDNSIQFDAKYSVICR